MTFLLYTRRGCHLCETAQDWLAAWAGTTAVLPVDVDGSPELRLEFGDRVPVLVRESDGCVLLEGRFTEADVARLLHGQATARVSAPVDRGHRSGPPPR
jgi:hypothetical protein